MIVSSSVEIAGMTGLEWVHTAEMSKESFEQLTFDWWVTIPIMHRLEDFPDYSDELLSLEGDRLLQWYVDHGWRDAVVTYEVRPYQERFLFPGPKNQQAYTVSFQVFLGEDWTLTDISFYGLESTHGELNVPTIPLLPTKWDRSIQRKADDAIRMELGRRGFASPEIYWQSKPLGETEFELEAYVEWGEQYTFGTIQIVNEVGEDWPLLQSTLDGKEYSTDKVNLLRHRLEELPSVSDVQLHEDVDPEHRQVHITFLATPNNTRKIKGVGGFATQATAWAFDGGFRWEVRNRQSPSVLISGRHTAGYRTFPQRLDLSHDGWATKHNLETMWALMPRYGINFLAKGDAFWDLQMGYNEALMDGDLGLRLIPHPYWTLDWTVGWSRHRYSAVYSQKEMFERWFGQGLLEQEALNKDTTIFLRRLQPEISLLEVEVTPYGIINEVAFQRFHLNGEHHSYFDRWLLRNRIEVGVLRWADEAPKTLHNRFFLGGGQSLRGWTYNKVHAPNYPGKHFDVNLGGDKSVFFSSELQYTLVSEYRLLTFLDVGRVWEKWDSPMPWYEWYPSTGMGVIVPTMLGDVAVTGAIGIYRDTELLHNPNRFVFHSVLVRELGK